MFRNVVILNISVILLISMLSCNSVKDIDELHRAVQAEIDAFGGEVGFAFVSLDTPKDSLFINAGQMFHAASTMKTPVMIEAYRQAWDGGITIQDPVLVHNTFRSIADGSEYSISAERDSGRDLHERIGELVSMRDIIYNMTILSGNLATNLVIDIVGAEYVMRTMKELGANDIQVLRGVEDMLAFERGMNNRTNARDLAILYAHLAMGTAVSPESDADMISILKDQRFREMIPAGLPEGTVVAHKTGSITGIRHDSGVVYLPDGRRYVLVILTSNPVNNDDGYTLGAALSRAVYNWMR
jgi:beta-lactamase class A